MCGGLGCAFLADQVVSLMGDPGHAGSGFALFSTCSHLNNITFCSVFLPDTVFSYPSEKLLVLCVGKENQVVVAFFFF